MSPGHADDPVLLVVDDEADGLRSELMLGLDGTADVRVQHPEDLKLDDLEAADLILMDYRLDNWPARDDQPVTFDVQTGMALATVLREIVDGNDRPRRRRPTAFALHTGHLSDASARILPPHVNHVVARLNNLEWVFEKSDEDRYSKAVQLAQAIRRLQPDWPTTTAESEVRARRLLNLTDDVGWFDRNWLDVRECQPPIYRLEGGTHGLPFLRWLLHQVFPYPCFLWSIEWVAARLRIDLPDLKRLMASDSDLAADLDRMKYNGIMAGFLGDRWWRAAIEDYTWDLGGHAGDGGEKYRETIWEKAGEDVELMTQQGAIVCLNEDFRPVGIACPGDAVRLRPDYWPMFADPAWMRIDDVKDDPDLVAMVEPLDHYRVLADE